MGSVNISLKKEAYEFLRSLKDKDKSFSDIILEFKESEKSSNVMDLFGGLKNRGINWEERKRRMKEFRDSFNKDVGNPGWVGARARFHAALYEEFENRGFDFSAIGNKNSLSFADKIKLIGKKIVKNTL